MVSARDQLTKLVEDLLAAAADIPVGYEVDIDSTYPRLSRYDIGFPFEIPVCSVERYTGMRKGIDCTRCYRFDVKMSLKQQVRCACGHIEEKREAIACVIYGYGVTFHDHELQIGEECDFFGEQLDRQSVSETLTKRFEWIGMGRMQHIVIPKRCTAVKSLKPESKNLTK